MTVPTIHRTKNTRITAAKIVRIVAIGVELVRLHVVAPVGATIAKKMAESNPNFHFLFPGHLRFSKNLAKFRVLLKAGSACGTIQGR